MDNNILTILTSEDKEEIRKSIKDIIIKQIEEDLISYSEGHYIFDEDEILKIQDMINEAIEEVKAEIKPLLKEKMFKEMKDKLGIEV
ncbi:hypothetical protein [Clostridium sp.]|uniref:hypothetical protein n=1 Tax=Clostridium sp. TaxID=1506 RepID=UPI0026155E30|nr:hypothetical protein [Clostridium sp.]